LGQTRHPEHENTGIFVWRANMRIDRLTVQHFKNSRGRPSNKHLPTETKANGAARRWVAFYGRFNECIRFDALRKWWHARKRLDFGCPVSTVVIIFMSMLMSQNWSIFRTSTGKPNPIR